MNERQKSARYLVGLTLLVLLTVTACATPTPPAPTPTPTRTPVLPTPTPTPTATPTITPTPTPTLPPDLLLPPQAAEPEGWPALPTELYFLRDGKIWSWLAEGGALESLPVAVEGDRVHAYRVTPDKRYVLYVTDAGKLYAFDRAQWQHTFIPTAGRLIDEQGIYFDMTPDAGHLVYMAWGVQPAAEIITGSSPFGAILAIALTDLRQPQRQLGFCSSAGDRLCAGMHLSPDGSYVAYEDGAGLWLSSLNAPAPRLLLSPTEIPPWRFNAWSPNSRWLVLEARTAEGTLLGLFNVETGQIYPIGDVACVENCQIGLSWGSQGLWVFTDTPQQGCLYEVQPAFGDTPMDMPYQTCMLGSWALHPASPLALPDGWVAFLHRGCGDDCPGPAPGLYFLGPDEMARPIALLDQNDGFALWAADGSAFLYFNADGSPARLGVTDGAGYWDVSRMLDSAYAFEWGSLVVPSEQ